MPRTIDDVLEELLDQPGCSDEEISVVDDDAASASSSSSRSTVTLIDVDLFDVDLCDAGRLLAALADRRLAIRSLELSTCCNAQLPSSLACFFPSAGPHSRVTAHLREVVIHSCDLSAASLQAALDGMLRLTALRKLSLASSQLTNDMCRAVVAFLDARHRAAGDKTKPFELDVQHNPDIDDATLGGLLAAAARRVAKLTLSGCAVGAAAVQQLADAVGGQSTEPLTLCELDVDQIPELPVALLLRTVLQPRLPIRRLSVAWSGLELDDAEPVDWTTLHQLLLAHPTVEDVDFGESASIPNEPLIVQVLQRNQNNNRCRSPMLMHLARLIYSEHIDVSVLPADVRQVYRQELLPAVHREELQNDASDSDASSGSDDNDSVW